MENNYTNSLKDLKIVQLNISDVGSTGTIMFKICDEIKKRGGEVYSFSRGWKKNNNTRNNHNFVGNYITNGFHALVGRQTGLNGYLSIFSTIKLIRFLKKNDVDIVHLHNLHAFCYNIPILFRYLKASKIKVIWTFHDCWPFTGYCTYFLLSNCNKWTSNCASCNNCPKFAKKFQIPQFNYKKKKALFCSIDNLIIVTPSEWLSKLVKQSFLKDKKTLVINNGINFDDFYPVKSIVKDKYCSANEYLVLGVAFDWGVRKGLDIFCSLANKLPKNYRILLVGVDSFVSKSIPSNIICLERTNSKKELAELYSAADVFVNPTREDNFPTVNIEALACGTPIITYNNGGSPEMLNKKCGIVLNDENIDTLSMNIIKICENKIYNTQDCIHRAHEFSYQKMADKYCDLYSTLK